MVQNALAHCSRCEPLLDDILDHLLTIFLNSIKADSWYALCTMVINSLRANPSRGPVRRWCGMYGSLGTTVSASNL